MGKKKAARQTASPVSATAVPVTPAFPIIPTEVFWELNPEVQEFAAGNPPPTPSVHYPPYWYQYYKTHGCFPRRACIPQPCAPV